MIAQIFSSGNLHKPLSSQAKNIFVKCYAKKEDKNRYDSTSQFLWYVFTNFPHPCKSNFVVTVQVIGYKDEEKQELMARNVC